MAEMGTVILFAFYDNYIVKVIYDVIYEISSLMLFNFSYCYLWLM